MPIKNTPEHYGTITKTFHWLISVMVLTMLAVGTTMVNMDDSSFKFTLYRYHKSFGILVLGLMTLRFLWRTQNVAPNLPNTMPRWQQIAARVSHYCLYLVLLVMPVSGLIMSAAGGYPSKFFGLFTFPVPIGEDKALSHLAGTTHLVVAYTIGALLLMHIGAALKHHLIDKDNILKRMLPFGK